MAFVKFMVRFTDTGWKSSSLLEDEPRYLVILVEPSVLMNLRNSKIVGSIRNVLYPKKLMHRVSALHRDIQASITSVQQKSREQPIP